MLRVPLFLIAAVPVLFSTALPAADVLMGRPVLGYVTESSPLRLRAILGVPGSAVMTGALTLPENIAQLYPAPGQAYALAVRPGDDPAVIALNVAASLAAVPLAGGLRQPDLVSFSPTGQAALLYSKAAGLQVIIGLPASPRIAANYNATAFSATLQAAALSDDGTRVLFAAAGGAFELPSSGQPQQILSTAGPAILAFFPNSPQAAIGDPESGSVNVWPSAPGSSTARPLASGLAGMAVIQASADGQSLWISNPAAQSIWSVEMQTAQVRTFNLQVAPATLDRLPGPDMFLIASASGKPAWIFFRQASQSNDAIAVFIPAAKKHVPVETRREGQN